MRYQWRQAICLELIIFLLIGQVSIGYAQNLVPNNNFDFFTPCPNLRGQINYAHPWYSPNGRTTDFAHLCAGILSTGVPLNNWGYQFPASGGGYGGIRTWALDLTFGIPYREYLAVDLVSPLVAGEVYFVSFLVSPGDSAGYVSDDIGLAFADAAIPADNVLDYTPAIRNEEGRYLEDFENWVEISGEYVATGGERHLIIGNFLPDSLTHVKIRPEAQGLFESTYFFIDKVIVEKCKDRIPNSLISAMDSALCPGEALALNVRKPETMEFEWLDGSTSAARRITEPGTYVIVAEVNGCTAIDSFEVYAEPAPAVYLGNDTTLCPGESLQLFADDSTSTILWEDGSIDPKRLISTAGQYSLIATRGNCSQIESISIHYAEHPIIPEPLDTTICLSEEITLSASSPGITYLWNDLSSADTLLVQDQGRYWVDIRTTCFAYRENFLLFTEDCGCEVFIPNVFTPNGDGINDGFLIEAREGIRDFELRIYDRWGKAVFQTRNASESWKGFLGNKAAHVGVYYWVLSYRCVESGFRQTIQERGHVSLFR